MRPTSQHLSAKEALLRRGLLRCSTCRAEKETDQFGRKADGFAEKQPHCKDCVNAKNRQYSAKPDAVAKKLEYQRRRRAAGYRPSPETQRRSTLGRYGIAPADYDRMLAEQGGLCAICGSDDPQTRAGGFFHVDHCHTTGAVRGLLCGSCNPALGAFQDSEAVLLAAIEYLRRAS